MKSLQKTAMHCLLSHNLSFSDIYCASLNFFRIPFHMYAILRLVVVKYVSCQMPRTPRTHTRPRMKSFIEIPSGHHQMTQCTAPAAHHFYSDFSSFNQMHSTYCEEYFFRLFEQMCVWLCGD